MRKKRRKKEGKKEPTHDLFFILYLCIVKRNKAAIKRVRAKAQTTFLMAMQIELLIKNLKFRENENDDYNKMQKTCEID